MTFLKDCLMLLIGIAMGAIFYFLNPVAGFVPLLIAGLVAVLVLYIVGAVLSDGFWRDLVRAVLVGINAGLNFVIIVAISSQLAIPALVLAGINVLAAFDPLASFTPYKFVLGLANFALPMAWPAIAVGIALAVLNLLGGIFGGLVDYLKLTDGSFSWAPICVNIKGGWISNLNYVDTSFNMGIFMFTDANATADYSPHELGHTLNIAAFGSLFHFIGAFDENVIGRGQNAFAELLANSNASEAPNIPMWG